MPRVWRRTYCAKATVFLQAFLPSFTVKLRQTSLVMKPATLSKHFHTNAQTKAWPNVITFYRTLPTKVSTYLCQIFSGIKQSGNCNLISLPCIFMNNKNTTQQQQNLILPELDPRRRLQWRKNWGKPQRIIELLPN